MKLIASAADLDEVRSLARALVFIYVSWSIQARNSEVACGDFLARLQREYPDEEIPVYRIDLSEQKGEVWDSVRKWLGKETWSDGLLTYGGYGAMLWVRRGKLAAFVAAVELVKPDRLMAMTRKAFELGDAVS